MLGTTRVAHEGRSEGREERLEEVIGGAASKAVDVVEREVGLGP